MVPRTEIELARPFQPDGFWKPVICLNHVIASPAMLSTQLKKRMKNKRWFAVLDLYIEEYMQKYKFSVSLQRNKHEVEVQIYGTDLQDAERKLRQIYPYGEITHLGMTTNRKNRSQSLNIAEALSVIVEEHCNSQKMSLADQPYPAKANS